MGSHSAIREALFHAFLMWGIIMFVIRHRFARIVGLIERLTSTGEPEVGAVRIDVWGDIAGKEVHHIACGIGQMREATGLSLSIGALMLARGELLTEEGGVYAPEACLDPREFITRLGAKGVKAYEDLAMTRQIA